MLVMQLKNVVLPAPLGPIRATISPRADLQVHFVQGRRPPKFMDTA
jgi:hypothetical protein